MKYKLRFKGRGVIFISIASWMVGLVSLSPGMISWKYSPERKGCQRDWKSINSFAYKICLMAIGLVLPLTFLLTCFFTIFTRARHSVIGNNATHMLSRKRLRKAERTLGKLILLFVMCWLPFCVFWAYSATASFQKRNAAVRGWNSLRWMRITVLLCQINYTLNPVVYIGGSIDLKQETKRLAKEIWMRLRCSRHQSRNAVSCSQMRGSQMQYSQMRCSQLQCSQMLHSQAQGSQMQTSQVQTTHMQSSQIQASQIQASQIQASQIQELLTRVEKA